jgi:polyhydroxybutyrate depolymerase
MVTKKLFLLPCFMLCLTQLIAQQRFDVKFMLDGYLRESIIVKPDKAPPPGGYPMVFMLHGTSGDGEKFYKISGWKELGEEENFITVFPSSLSWCYLDDSIEKNNTRWVNASVTDFPCSGPPQDYVDDVKFLKILAQRISDTLPVNRKMIFASGFSNGSVMIHKLAIDAGDVFSAVAGSSGPLFKGDSSAPVNRIPVWFIVGSKDDLFFFPPHTEVPFGGDTILDYLHSYLNRALVCQGLEWDYTKTIMDSIHTYQFLNNATGQNGKPYIFSILKDMTHEYPNGKNYFFSAPRVFWEFFKRSVSLSTDRPESKGPEVLISPNPSDDQINISVSGSSHPYHWQIFDLNGRLRKTGFGKSDNNIRIRKADLGPGIFIFKIDLNYTFIVKKFIFH